MKILDGIRIIEVAQGLFVPGGGAILGDWGAEIIKIENPKGGDMNRSLLTGNAKGAVPPTKINYAFEHQNRNKKSLAVDLGRPAGRQILCQLVEKSDVLLMNFLAPARRKLRIDYDDLKPYNPRLVYVRGLGYGEKGPDADKPGYDFSAFWARSGIAASLGEPGTPPSSLRPGMGDLTSAIAIAAGTVAALFAREKSGEGQIVDVSLLHTAIWIKAVDSLAAVAEGVEITRQSRTEATNPLWNSYQARDGKWFQLVMLQSERYWTTFCKAIGRPELENHPQFNSHDKRLENNKALITQLDKVFLTRTAKEWAVELEKYGEIPWAPIQESTDLAEDPQVLANGFIVDFTHPVYGPTKAVTSPVRFSQTPSQIISAAPGLGQQTEEVLRGLGYSLGDIARLKADGVVA